MKRRINNGQWSIAETFAAEFALYEITTKNKVMFEYHLDTLRNAAVKYNPYDHLVIEELIRLSHCQ